MKKTFLVLIAAIAAVSSIQASEAAQPRPTAQYVLSQERIDYMASRLGAMAAEEISKSAPKASSKKTVASTNRAPEITERVNQARKIAATSG